MDCLRPVIVDIISAVAGAAAQSILPTLKQANSNINSICFMYGPAKELQENIVQMDKAPSQKFSIWPALMLFTDITTMVSSTTGKYAECTLQMALAMPTSYDYKADERYTKNYIPVLYPLWQRFIKELADSGCFAEVESKIRYNKYDRIYWGKQGNTLASAVDAIELQNIRLKLFKDAKPRAIAPADKFFDPTFFNGEFFQ